MALKSIVLLYEFEEVFSELETDEDRSKMIMAIFAYKKRGEEPEFTGLLRFAWRTHIKPKLDEMSANYQAKCDKLRANVQKRWKNKDNVQTNTNVSDVVQTNTNVDDKDKDKDKEKDKDKSSRARAKQTPIPVVVNENDDTLREAVRFYTDHISALYADGIGKVKLLLSQYGMAEFKRAVTLMAKRGGRSLNYLEKILQDPHEDTGQLEEATIRAVLK